MWVLKSFNPFCPNIEFSERRGTKRLGNYLNNMIKKILRAVDFLVWIIKILRFNQIGGGFVIKMQRRAVGILFKFSAQIQLCFTVFLT